MTRSVALSCVILIVATVAARSQQVDTTRADPPAQTAAQLVEAADSARARGDIDAAHEGYRRAVELDPLDSRATFRLAGAEPVGSSAAIALYRRYTDLEPDDEWGWIALAEALTDAERFDDAIGAYTEALLRQPHERDAIIARSALQIDAGRHADAIGALTAWTADHDDDIEAWLMLAQVHRVGGSQELELASLKHVAHIDPTDPSSERLAVLRARTAPSIAPSVSTSFDSDESRLLRSSLAGDVALSMQSRLGVHLERSTATSADGDATIDRALVYFTRRTPDGFTLDARAGLALREDAKGKLTRAIEPIGRLRMRWSGDRETMGGEIRLQRSQLDASAALVENNIVLEEALGALEIPAGEIFGVHLLGAVGALAADNDRNLRFRIAGGPTVKIQPLVQLGLRYDGTMYAEQTSLGYFAPAFAHVIEATAYGEIYDWEPFALAADVGAGVQQIVEEEGAPGVLSPALRGWLSIEWAFAPASALSLELEAYNIIGGASVAGESRSWSYGSVAIGLRIAL